MSESTHLWVPESQRQGEYQSVNTSEIPEGIENSEDETYASRVKRASLSRNSISNASMPPLVRSLSRRSMCVPNDRLHRRLTVFNDDEMEIAERVDSLNLMRPFRLIGNAQRLTNWAKYRISDNKLKTKSAKVRKVYRFQNEMIDKYQEIDSLLDAGIHIEMIQNYADNTSSESDSEHSPILNDQVGDLENQLVSAKKRRNVPNVPGNINSVGGELMGHEDQEEGSRIVSYAINFTFALNIFLLISKIVMIYFTNSFSLIASVVDSSLDFLSTLIIYFANRYAGTKSARFPVGRKQLEPLGVLVFSVIIIVSFLQVFIESFRALISNDKTIRELNIVSISVMGCTIGSKLIAWAMFKNVKNSSIQALTEDAKTDIVFNVFSLIFPLIGWVFQLWFMDPLGACLLCFYVVIQWGLITFEHIDHLSGSNAPREYYQQVLYLILRFTDNISKIKNFRMYHMGDDVNVEVDIVLRNKNLTLKDYHDLAESLQYAIETLPYVNRCFVHIDYKVKNYLGHLQ